MLGVRWRGVRAADNGRVPCPVWPGRGAVTAVCQPATAAVIAARISPSSTVSVIGTMRLPAALVVAQVGGGAVEDGSGLAG